MKHIKKHIKRLHKIRVHNNRWLIWAVVISAIAFISLFYFIKISDMLFYQDFDDSPVLFKSGQSYKDSYLGFSIRHPVDWGVEFQNRNIIEFNNPYKQGEGFTVGVYDIQDMSAIKGSLSASKEQSATVDGEQSSLLTLVPSAKDDSTMAALIPHGANLYVIKSNAPGFTGLVSSFRFVPQLK